VEKSHENLFGISVYDLLVNGKEIISVTQNGIINIENGITLNENTMVSYSKSKHYTVGVRDGKLYYWKSNNNSIERDNKINIFPNESLNIMNGKIVIWKATSGCNHQAALDTMGNAYTWGSNTDNQLGHFNSFNNSKTRNNKSLMEDWNVISLKPKILPLSLKVKVKDISCGSNYTILLSKSK
jgi:alpha-tubulin suppressor-like RCC1 family protein